MLRCKSAFIAEDKVTAINVRESLYERGKYHVYVITGNSEHLYNEFKSKEDALAAAEALAEKVDSEKRSLLEEIAKRLEEISVVIAETADPGINRPRSDKFFF